MLLLTFFDSRIADAWTERLFVSRWQFELPPASPRKAQPMSETSPETVLGLLEPPQLVFEPKKLGCEAMEAEHISL